MTDDAPILLDVTRLIWRRWKGRYPTGIDRVCLAYLRHFGEHAQAVVHYRGFRRILDRNASRDLFALLDEPAARLRTSLPAGFIRHLGGLNCAGGGRSYLNVGHTGLNSPGFRAWVKHADVRSIYLVHDLIPITDPQFCRAGEDGRHRERMRTILRTAAGVIGNSQATLDNLGTFAAGEGLAMPPALAAWLGSEPLPTVEPAAAPPTLPTFVTLGTIEARKNHLLLLQVWSRLIDSLGRHAPRLLVLGQRGWEAEPVFAALGSDKLRGHVVELNRCSDAELAMHLSGARALLFPSFAEGYGLPLIEALGAGTAVIASDLPVFRELCGTIPDFLSPHDPQAWEAAVLDYARPDSRARAAQLERMSGFRPPTWEDHFSAVEAWLPTLGSAA